MTIEEVDAVFARLPGARRTSPGGLVQWRYRGRLVARQLDADHIVVRSAFAVRGRWVERDPATFSVPARFARHMMVVCDLRHGHPSRIEAALQAAYELQRRHV